MDATGRSDARTSPEGGSMRIGQTSAVSFVSKIVSSAAGFVATIYFANVLLQDVLGAYYLIQSIVGWLTLLGTMGLASAVTKRMSEGEEQGNYKLAGGLIIGGFAVIISTAVFLGDDLVARYFGIEQVELIVVLVVVGLLGSYVDAMLQGAHLVHVSAVLGPVRRITRTGSQIGGVMLGFGLAALVYGYAIGGVLVVVLGGLILGGPYRLPTKKHFQRLVSYAKYSWMGQLEGKTYRQADILLLGLFTSAPIVAIYGITWSLAAFLLLFSNSISSALFPEISKQSYEGGVDTVQNLVERSLAYAGLITIPGFVGGLILSERLMRIYGQGFVPGADILWLLILSILLYGYQRQFVNALGGIDRPDDAFRVNAVLIGVNVGLNVILIYLYGMVGAAVATVASTLLSCVVGYYTLNEHFDVPLPFGEIGRQTVAAAGMGTIVLVTKTLTVDIGVLPSNELYTVGLVIVGGLSYFGLLAVLSSDFRTTVLQNLPETSPFGGR
jgi:O-antigen/teichoic acid export membrane protein